MEFISVLSMTNPSHGRESLNVHFTFVFPSSPPPCSSQSSAVLGFPAPPASGLDCAGPALPLLNFLVPSLALMSSSREKLVQRDGPEREPSTGKRKGWLQEWCHLQEPQKPHSQADPWGWEPQELRKGSGFRQN